MQIIGVSLKNVFAWNIVATLKNVIYPFLILFVQTTKTLSGLADNFGDVQIWSTIRLIEKNDFNCIALQLVSDVTNQDYFWSPRREISHLQMGNTKPGLRMGR